MAELEETYRVFNSVVEGLEPDSSDADLMSRREWSQERREKIQVVVEKMWAILGTWKDYAWNSPGPGYVNTRKTTDIGVTPDDGVLTRHKSKSAVHVDVQEVPAVPALF
ncbi:hypothetical protein NPX13_g7493 [Xylaria arbuscula]|uniref:Uncharacterized protein n=1 Tax=Xylaria arbuscula TaxID=114810 RepID=A0A9W8N9V7_9PEZI|nr:hypothetical protein NPX13_g7493 [Xylaria arbuscula]